MRKFYAFCIFIALSASAVAKEYTFASLAAISGSGVTIKDGEYVFGPTSDEEITLDGGGLTVSGSELTIADGNTLRIADGDVVKFAADARLCVNGDIMAEVENGATFTATDEDAAQTAQGIRVFCDKAQCRFSNVTFEFVGISFGSPQGSLTLDNCQFKNHNGRLSSNAVNFTAVGSGNAITECLFTGSYGGCVASGANTPVGITISHCEFTGNGTSERLLPAINLTCSGDNDIVITDNSVIGRAVVTRAGGIALSNLLSMDFTNTCTVSRNVVKDNSYGITITGGGNVSVCDNEISDNHFIANPMSGGSGINITNPYGTTTAMVSGNTITGHYWGITVIGANDVNCGKTADPLAADYNPGNNTFSNNGNGDAEYARCDLANNGTATLYAQGNTWSVAQQTPELIETCVYHKADNPSLGEVIFIPASDGAGVESVVRDISTPDGQRYNLLGQPVGPDSRGIVISNGKKHLVRD